MKAVHLFVPTYEPSAVGAHTAQVQSLLRSEGFESEIFTAVLTEENRDNARFFRVYGADYPARRDDVLIYQLAIGAYMADFLFHRPEALVVNYHNLTPIYFYAPWDRNATRGLAWGRHQLARLASRARMAITPSEFNAAELRGVGYVDAKVVPILFDPKDFERKVDESTLERLRKSKERGGADILFVGRVSPNKRHEDLIKALAVYRRLYDDDVRLHLVGGAASDTYWAALQQFTRDLGMEGAVNLTGSVTQGELVAHYKTADVFLCLSEHEGFCVPLLEAMHNDLPIVAYKSSAVPETLGGAGLLLPDKSADVVATAVHRVLSDTRLATELVSRGRRRLDSFDLRRTRAALLSALQPMLGDRSE